MELRTCVLGDAETRTGETELDATTLQKSSAYPNGAPRQDQAGAVTAYGWERDEWWDSLRNSTLQSCPPGNHRINPSREGGGTCTNCGDPVDQEEM